MALDNKNTLVQIAVMWAEAYEMGNKEVCEILLEDYKKELETGDYK